VTTRLLRPLPSASSLSSTCDNYRASALAIDRDKSPLLDADLAVTHRPRSGSAEEPPVPVDHILQAVGQLRSRNDDNPDAVVFDASANLLEHIAGPWDQQDD
jgi:hypothetical protein